MENLYDLRTEDKCKHLLSKFTKYYKGYTSTKPGKTSSIYEPKEVKKSKMRMIGNMSFFWSVFCGAGWPAVVGTLLQTFSVVFQALNPQILR